MHGTFFPMVKGGRYSCLQNSLSWSLGVDRDYLLSWVSPETTLKKIQTQLTLWSRDANLRKERLLNERRSRGKALRALYNLGKHCTQYLGTVKVWRSKAQCTEQAVLKQPFLFSRFTTLVYPTNFYSKVFFASLVLILMVLLLNLH